MPMVTDESFANRYQEKDSETSLVDQIEKLVGVILGLEIDESLKKKMLSHALWEKTVGTGNFKGQYRSSSVVKSAKTNQAVPVQRDHVIPKKELILRFLAGESIKTVLNDCVTCTVTREEHRKLHNQGQNPEKSWDRYRKAGVGVWDMAVPIEFIPVPAS